MPERHHARLSRPDVEVDSPLIDCRLVNLSTSGLAIETSVGLRLGVPYPFRLHHGKQTLGTEAVVRWCKLVRTETVHGESRPVYRAGAAFVEWQPLKLEKLEVGFEEQIDETLDQWMAQSRRVDPSAVTERTIIRTVPRQPSGPVHDSSN